MEIKIYQEVFKVINNTTLRKLGFNLKEEKDRFDWQKWATVDLIGKKRATLNIFLKELTALLKNENTKNLRGLYPNYKDVKTWLKVLDEGTASKAKSRTVEKFKSLLVAHLRQVDGHRIFCKDKLRDVWFCYYVSRISFHARTTDAHGRVVPEHVNMEINWIEFGGTDEQQITFWPEECKYMTVEEALLRKNFICENKEMRDLYLKDKQKFTDEHNKIGKQFHAKGIGTTDVDGNDDDDDRYSYWNNTKKIILDKSGDPANVVMDLFYESDKDKRDDDVHYDRYFWEDMPDWANENTDKEDIDEIRDDLQESPEPEIPLHPMVACFDLRRHMRLRIHIAQLIEYKYDNKLGEKLVLPPENRDLVEMLLAHKGGFQDIIKGKGTGAIIMCAGQPGTGKTLTSEVYAEVCGRPLYTVQCSQLGIDPNDLEGQLLKVFMRAQRWNAILLLDEADVYVAERGKNLTQNAVVGVFLRTLEYYHGVMFLTTNRADLIDDAIASRCVARIDYDVPSIENQERIWKILSSTSKVKIADNEIKNILNKHNKLTGRDIKNLLKLAIMVSTTSKKPIIAETIDFVKHFKPTMTEEEKIGKRVL